MSRAAAISRAHAYFDDGGFLADLRRRVAIPSSSQEPERAAALRAYLTDEMVPLVAAQIQLPRARQSARAADPRRASASKTRLSSPR